MSSRAVCDDLSARTGGELRAWPVDGGRAGTVAAVSSDVPPPSAASVDEVIAALLAGACVGIPTDTVYGIAARLDDPVAIEALFALKGRAATKAMAVLVDEFETAAELGHFDGVATDLARRFWPGPLTLVVRRREGVVADLGGDHATIGVRCPDHDVVRDLARAVGPIVTTSANRTGEPTIETAADIAAAFGPGLAAVLDGGRLSDAASTVVDVTGTGLVVLREGPISTAELTDLS